MKRKNSTSPRADVKKQTLDVLTPVKTIALTNVGLWACSLPLKEILVLWDMSCTLGDAPPFCLDIFSTVLALRKIMHQPLFETKKAVVLKHASFGNLCRFEDVKDKNGDATEICLGDIVKSIRPFEGLVGQVDPENSLRIKLEKDQFHPIMECRIRIEENDSDVQVLLTCDASAKNDDGKDDDSVAKVDPETLQWATSVRFHQILDLDRFANAETTKLPTLTHASDVAGKELTMVRNTIAKGLQQAVIVNTTKPVKVTHRSRHVLYHWPAKRNSITLAMLLSKLLANEITQTFVRNDKDHPLGECQLRIKEDSLEVTMDLSIHDDHIAMQKRRKKVEKAETIKNSEAPSINE